MFSTFVTLLWDKYTTLLGPHLYKGISSVWYSTITVHYNCIKKYEYNALYSILSQLVLKLALKIDLGVNGTLECAHFSFNKCPI